MFINFIIPENFLTNFNVKDVIIKNIENNNINREKKPPSISLKDTKIFLNSLCKNVIINKDGECNTFNREYIEYKSFIIKVRVLLIQINHFLERIIPLKLIFLYFL